MAITPLPTLDRTSASFKTDVDDFFATDLPTFVTEANSLASGMASDVASASASASSASASESAALTYRNNASASASSASSFSATAATNASTSTTNAANASASASAAAASAANAAAATGIDMAAISQTKTGTVTKTFVYDTKNDSDGGAWRKRCQHTSWYNETLNTATRGATREFPAVAVIAVTSSAVTIYDATSSTCPMWMVFNSTAYGFISATTSSSVFAINGYLLLGDSANALSIANFISDDIIRNSVSSVWRKNTGGSIALRNVSGTSSIEFSTAGIVNNNVNCIAATVLPNATIDNTTGLPVPTVYVGTDAGLSRISHDGTVSNWTDTSGNSYNYISSVSIADDYVFFSAYLTEDGVLHLAFPVSDTLSSSNASTPQYLSGLGLEWDTNRTVILHGHISNLAPFNFSKNAVSHSRGLTLLKPNPSAWGSGLHATITDWFNSGWQFGDIRGAWLSDTVAGTISDTTELVTNGTFTTDSGWTKDTGITITDGALHLATSSSGSANQVIVLGAGVEYTITITITSYTTGTVRVQAYNAEDDIYKDLMSAGTHHLTVRGDGTSAALAIWGLDTTTASIDNVSIKVADADRSYKNNGLIVTGTITKSAVNTGCELMGYSGFDSSNYLYQAYNPDLDFGTGDFYVMGWVKGNSSSNEFIFERGAGSATIDILVNSSNVLYWRLGTSDMASKTIPETDWVFFVGYRINNQAGLYIDGSFVGETADSNNYSGSTPTLVIGKRAAGDAATNLSLALFRIGAGAITATQIKFIYESEKHLFAENTACTLAGSSSNCKSLDYDTATDTYHVVTTTHYSEFRDLVRVNTESGTFAAVSSENGIVAKGA